MVRFEWDPNKAALNVKKHGVNFVEASSAFDDETAWIIEDPDHSLVERREILIGRSEAKRMLFISFTQRTEAIRIISARRAGEQERIDYEQNKTRKKE